MKLKAERDGFAEVVTWTTRVAGGRAALPALAGVLLEAGDGRLTCRATDLEVSAEVSVPVAVDEPGKVLLPGRLLAQLVGRLPAAPVELAGDAARMGLRCGAASFNVRGMSVEDFPSLPTPDPQAPRGSLKAETFVRVTNQVVRAASTDEARPVLTGVKLLAGRGALVAAATDSYRLATRRVTWEQDVEADALVPGRALAEASRAAAESGGEVTVVFEPAQVTFLLGDRRLTTRLIEGTFPDYEQLIPTEYSRRVVIPRAPFIEALQRVAIVALGQANTPVLLKFADDAVELSAGTQEVGEANESVPVTLEGDAVEIAFNPTFLLAGLESAGTENVIVELRDGLKPAVVRPDDGQDFLYLLMPVRIS